MAVGQQREHHGHQGDQGHQARREAGGEAGGTGRPSGGGGHGQEPGDDGTDVIQGRYRLQRLIGRGGMGEVWRALDESLGRRVAVKCLKPLGHTGDAGFTRILQERFRREARVAAGLQHRGITVVHDFGEHEGLLFLVMELLEGRNLLQTLDDAQRQPLPVPDITDIAEQVALALAYTHAQGVVHRDLKPANIIRLTDGAVKICDFGIARLGHDIGFTSRLTGTGVAMGTPHYMSPEQIGNSEVDERSDLYSLGCVLYELATGRPPFDQDDPWSVLVSHRDAQPVPPRTERPDLPVELERLILDLLAKAPEERPQNAADVAGRLKAMRAAADVAPVPPLPTAQLPAWAREVTTGLAARPALGAAKAARHELTGAWSTRSATASDDPHALAELEARQAEAVELGRAGRWQESYERHIAVATGRDRAQGTEHPDTLTSRYEAAYGLTRLGRTDEALRLYAYVAEVRRRVLGPDHPDTLAARHEAAYTLAELGRHLEAHREFSAVLAARERTVGGDHPDTLHCKHNLAYNLGQLGRTGEAYTTAVEVADARSRVLGPEHADTLGTRFEVGFTLGQAGRWAEALDTYHEVTAARSRLLGPEHPETLAARYETGICLGRLGRTEEALALYEDLVAVLTRTAGPDDEETLRARQALGVNLGHRGHWERALAEARDVAAIRERVLGANHPDTLVSKRETAVCLGWLGRWSEALTAYRAVATAREALFGPDHPDTLTSRNDEARCLEHLGRTAEAQALYQRVAAHTAEGPQAL